MHHACHGHLHVLHVLGTAFVLANEGNSPSRQRTFRKPELYDLETFPWSRVSKITEWLGNNAPDNVLRKSKSSVTVLSSLVVL